jgi:sugar phosphate permease
MAMQEPTASAALISTDPKSTSSPASRVRYQVLGAACILSLITYIQRLALLRDSGPELKKSLNLNDTQMGNVAAAFLVAYGLCQVPGGWLADRFGARHLITILVLAWSLITGAVALAGVMPAEVVYASLLLLIFCFGLLQAGIFPAWARVIADWMPMQERASAQGVMWTCSRLGGAIIPFIFGGLLLVLGNWMPVFCVLAAVGFLWAAFFWRWFRNGPEEMGQVNAAERALIASERATLSPAAGPLPWFRMLSSVSVWSLCLMYGFIGFAGNFFTSTLTRYLHDHRGLSDSATRWLSSLPLACSMAACFLGGVLSDWIIRRTGNRKWGRRLNGSVGLLLAGLMLLGTIWVPNDLIWLLAILFSAAFFCNDLSMGPAWASCADIAERHAGALSGAMNMTGAFLGAAGMSLAGKLMDRHETRLMFIIFACSYGLAAICWLGVDVTKRLTAPT